MKLDTTQLLNALSEAEDIKAFLDANEEEFLTLTLPLNEFSSIKA